MSKPSLAMLVVLDGWGWREEDADNAVRLAHTPNFDRLYAGSPHAFLSTSGLDVGLPPGQMGNSEVGHLNLGAGRVVMQDLPRIDAAVADGELARRIEESGLVASLKKTGGTCHIIGLMSPGGVHAHQDHAVAVAKILRERDIPVAVHALTDGRDTAPRSASEALAKLEADLPEGAPIVTVCGRYFAMDRDKRWDRVKRAYDLLVRGEGTPRETPLAAVEASYAADISDEFIEPAVVGAYTGMKDGDAILCTNFRADRARELLDALLLKAFDGFDRGTPVSFCAAAGMASYSGELDQAMVTLFPRQSLEKGLGEVVAEAGLAQVRAAETEKYPHVTYFLNGGRETPYPGEDRILVPSPKVATYDLQPEMSAPELTEKVLEAIRSGKYSLIVLNYANPDMVGHTGSLPAAIKAVETVDTGLGKLAEAVQEMSGALLVTADHGNCELMRDPQTGNPHTAHTTHPVPIFLAGRPEVTLADGRLGDVAPTLLALIGLPQPAEMTGKSLLRAL
ncbi:2,3-bisphosphoglycerate-independent phosphoglycerate mutase [Aquabacter sp. L1I39]|uniref:2,3-bisphosphoglycerate-independent phosphoglycerate mutase n=1 Tax=Aquabacter sp. L1I39 TaxID=2820278 RepID=UPI001ADA0131|nr:2,3-bisphosphoglycerate-independent phosphoglycerate mutase [Aquabacter sp. L1I39]QTL05808.1 2,3-bisphosphoglycerate-independent phosphoglycerate mutase [Aquabacter sp. L1I39]